MKMHFVLAALMMIGAAGCATAPAQEDQATVTSEVRPDVPATIESSDVATTSDMSLPADPTAGAAPVVEEAPAPSSLGASSSGRGH
jgi:hypothetical protein